MSDLAQRGIQSIKLAVDYKAPYLRSSPWDTPNEILGGKLHGVINAGPKKVRSSAVFLRPSCQRGPSVGPSLHRKHSQLSDASLVLAVGNDRWGPAIPLAHFPCAFATFSAQKDLLPTRFGLENARGHSPRAGPSGRRGSERGGCGRATRNSAAVPRQRAAAPRTAAPRPPPARGPSRVDNGRSKSGEEEEEDDGAGGGGSRGGVVTCGALSALD